MTLILYVCVFTFWELPRWLRGKESPASAGDTRDVGSSPGSEDLLEGEMATHSSVLAWRIHWREEPDGLQSIGSQRVGHDRATEHMHTHSYYICTFFFRFSSIIGYYKILKIVSCAI